MINIYRIIFTFIILFLFKKKKFFKKMIHNDNKEDIILQKLNHKNIVKLKKIKQYSNYKVLYLKDYQMNTFEQYDPKFIKDFNLWEKKIKIIAKQLFSALVHLKNNDIIHNDIHPRNILFCPRTLKAIIIDFDVAHIGKKFITKLKGNRFYSAPEKIISLKENYEVDYKIDIYGIGAILHVLLTGKTIFYNFRYEDIDYKKNSPIFKDFFVNYSYECYDLLEKVLNFNHNLRISPEEALQHNWFKN